jgi:hypothetical protein
MVPCVAQPMQARFTVGATTFADDGAVTEAAVGGGVRFHFSRRWSLEPEFLYVSKRNDHSSILWGNIAFDFLPRDRRIVPYWYGGPGIVRHTSSFGQFSFTSTEAAFGTGAGVRFMLSDRVFVAPQFRLGIADGVFAEVAGSIGYVLRK